MPERLRRESHRFDRRECLDEVVIFNEIHLRRFFIIRLIITTHPTHLSLDKDCPRSRPIQPPRNGRIIALSQVGRVHHRYERPRA